jgi:hypothetical protein
MELRMKAGELSKQKLFVGTPMYGGMCAGMFARSIGDLSAICTHYGISLQLFFLFNESLITRARNYICDEFMRADSNHLMFIDSDIGFDAKDVVALLAMQLQNPDYEIIGGPYPKKTICWEKIKQAVDKGAADNNPNELEKFVGDFVFNPKAGTSSIPLGQPCEVLEIGTGFMMINKTAMDKFKDANPQYSYKPDHIRTEHFDGSREIMQYFQAEIDQLDYAQEYLKILKNMPMDSTDSVSEYVQKSLKDIEERASKKSKRYLSEDYWFSQKCQQLDIKTFLCPWMKLSHMGSWVFGGSLADLARIGAQATADHELLQKTKKKKVG